MLDLDIAARRHVLCAFWKDLGKPVSGADVEFSIKEEPITMMLMKLKAGSAFARAQYV